MMEKRRRFLTGTLLLSMATNALSPSPFSSRQSLPNIRAAVIVPGFLTGGHAFSGLAAQLTARGIPTVAVPMPNWHWLPCLGGRSMRPILERLDFAVRHVASSSSSSSSAAAAGVVVNQLPAYDYSVQDLYTDFLYNPGGIYKVGGSDRVEDYPVVEPCGKFPLPASGEAKGKIALIGHSAGGWISRIYLSKRNYGGKVYAGSDLVHSLVTLGTPHAPVPGPAFEGVRWCSEESLGDHVRQLAVGGTGFLGGEWGSLTAGSYAFCAETPDADISRVDGDGITPIHSALAWSGAEKIVLDNVTHFCWSKVAGSRLVAPELTKDEAAGRPWYGSDAVLDQWAGWLNV